jgi:hypothetical protein
MDEAGLLREIEDLQRLIDYKGFEVRSLEESDWDTLVGWWKWWRWAIMPKDFLPENGTGGIMVVKDGVCVVAGFLYTTNAKVVILDFIVSNPSYKNKNRKTAVEVLIKEAEVRAKRLKCKHIFSISKSTHLIDAHKELGWIVDNKPSYEIIKNL